MPTFKVDDCFADHPKTLDAIDRDPRTIALWLLAGTYCAKHMTDGRITPRQLRVLGIDDPLPLAEILVVVGLWKRTDTHFAFHEWDRWNETRDEIEERRESARERRRRYRDRERRRRERHASPDANVTRSAEKANDVVKGHASGDGATDAKLRDRIGKDRLKVKEGLKGPRSADPDWKPFALAYRKRYLARKPEVLDYPIGNRAGDWLELAHTAAAYPDPLDAVCRALDTYFQDAWASSRDWPVPHFVREFTKYLSPPKRVEDEDARKRKAREEREFQRKLKREREEAKKWASL